MLLKLALIIILKNAVTSKRPIIQFIGKLYKISYCFIYNFRLGCLKSPYAMLSTFNYNFVAAFDENNLLYCLLRVWSAGLIIKL